MASSVRRTASPLSLHPLLKLWFLAGIYTGQGWDIEYVVSGLGGQICWFSFSTKLLSLFCHLQGIYLPEHSKVLAARSSDLGL